MCLILAIFYESNSANPIHLRLMMCLIYYKFISDVVDFNYYQLVVEDFLIFIKE
jgi:hypothetical protein